MVPTRLTDVDTDDAAKQWTAMGQRHRDYWIATNVFKQARSNLDRNPENEFDYGRMRDIGGNGWWFESLWPQSYSTDRDGDVLKFVREHWPVEDVSVFANELVRIWSDRRVKTMARSLSYNDCVMYFPGDYSEAAFRIMTGRKR